MEPDKVIEIHSDKFDTDGKILYYHAIVTKLLFSYDDREYTIGIRRTLNEELAVVGLRIMETTIEKLVSNPGRASLHYWYIDDRNVAHGVVTGHKKLQDAMKIHTSEIISTATNALTGDVIITTSNTDYYCNLSYCRFRKQDMFPEAFPDYETIRERFKGTERYPEIEPGKVLLVLADFTEYYFHSLFVTDKNGERAEYSGYPHVGMFQDSYLIEAEGEGLSIDLRYFPHYGNIEFYTHETNGMPLYVENIGGSTIYVDLNGMRFSLAPGERKELSEDNAEKDSLSLTLPNGDLYPAGIL